MKKINMLFIILLLDQEAMDKSNKLNWYIIETKSRLLWLLLLRNKFSSYQKSMLYLAYLTSIKIAIKVI